MDIEKRLPPTTRRVTLNTARYANEFIRLNTERSVMRFDGAGSDAISERLSELEHEWDIERTLEANAATITLLSAGLAAGVSRKWLAFTGVVAGFLLQHAVQGWCPPVVPFRHKGIRTQTEIDAEILALRLMRGDFGPPLSGREALARIGFDGTQPPAPVPPRDPVSYTHLGLPVAFRSVVPHRHLARRRRMDRQAEGQHRNPKH